MRVLVDANMPRQTVAMLVGLGHDAVSSRDILPVNAPDQGIAALAIAENRAILTRDKDFADLRVYPPSRYAGIIVLRPEADAGRDAILGLVMQTFASLGAETVRGRLVISDERGLRMRRDLPAEEGR